MLFHMQDMHENATVEGTDFVEDINVKNGVTNTTIEIDGKPVDPNDPLAEQAANAAHGKIVTSKCMSTKPPEKPNKPPHLDSNISQ